MSCCALLQLASEDVSVSLPQLLQVNGMRLEEPEAGDSVVERTGARLFFTTLARDFSCSCTVGVSEAAALSLSGLGSMAEFQEAHATGTPWVRGGVSPTPGWARWPRSGPMSICAWETPRSNNVLKYCFANGNNMRS